MKAVLSPKTQMLIFVLLVAFVFFFLLDWVNVPLNYVVRYFAFVIAVGFYVLLTKILEFRARRRR
jgi:Flp pilus assembly protein TadB